MKLLKTKQTKSKTTKSSYLSKMLKDSGISNVSKKLWLDFAMFAGAVYCMMTFSKVVDDALDYFMPDEEEMLKQMQREMKQMQEMQQ